MATLKVGEMSDNMLTKGEAKEPIRAQAEAVDNAVVLLKYQRLIPADTRFNYTG